MLTVWLVVLGALAVAAGFGAAITAGLPAGPSSYNAVWRRLVEAWK